MTVLVVCRQASDYLKNDNVVSPEYKCAFCEKALQLTPAAAATFKAGGVTLACNSCGLPRAREAESVVVGPSATAQMIEWGLPPFGKGSRS